jgi:WD40 repeat protein/serine/threonine protein kinase
MRDVRPAKEDSVPLDLAMRIDEVCNRFELAWKAQEEPRIEDYLGDWAEPDRSALLRELRGIADQLAGQLTVLSSKVGPEHETPTGAPVQRDIARAGAILGDYELLGVLGKGGMGLVYRARQRSANRIVALKVIRQDQLENRTSDQRREWLERFRTEAQAAARLEHDHIVPVYEVGASKGELFYSMRYVEGRSLAEMHRAGPLSPRRAAAYLEPIARAVDFAHTHGIVHRDLKPSNILVDTSDRPFVTDFGLAKWVESAGDKTLTGQALGTPPYMSPEQARSAAQVGPASDVYSLGATLYDLLTGRPPFQAADPVETLRQIREEEPAPPRRLNPAIERDLETITLKCLHKEPERRYVSAAALADDLRAFLDGLPIQARPSGPGERLLKWARRRPAVAALSSAVGIATLCLIASLLALWHNAERRGEAVKSLEEAKGKIAAADADLLLKQGRVKELQGTISDLGKEQRAREEHLHRLGYVQNMRHAWTTWERKSDIASVRRLLESQTRPAGKEDLRSFDWYYLWALSHRERNLHGHKKDIKSVAFSAAADILASASSDGFVKLWDPATGQELATKLPRLSSVTCLAFTADGQFLAVGYFDGSIRLWETATGKPKTSFEKSKEGVYSLAFSPDAKTLAYGTNEGTVKLRDLETGAVRVVDGHKHIVYSVAYSPDGKLLASSSGNDVDKKGIVKIVDARTMGTLSTLTQHTGRVTGVAFSPDSKLLATCSMDRTIKLWEAATGKLQATRAGHTAGVNAVSFNPDGTRLASAGADRTVKLWDVNPHLTLPHPRGEGRVGGETVTCQGHVAEVSSLAFSRDGRTLGTGDRDGTVKLWDVNRATDVVKLTASAGRRVFCVALTPDGKTLASGDSDGTLELWDVPTRRQRGLRKHGSVVFAVAFSPDRRSVASAGSDGVKLWDLATLTEEASLPHEATVRYLAFSHDGKTLATATTSENFVRVWDLATRKEKRRFEGHQNAPITALVSAGTGNKIASASRIQMGKNFQGEIKIWDSDTGDNLATLLGHALPVHALAFGPGSKTLASAGGNNDRTMKVRELSSSKETLSLPAQPTDVRSLLFAPDGKSLISGTTEVKVWDVVTGLDRLTLPGAAEVIWSLAITPDGNTLAAGLENGTILLWEAGTDKDVGLWR